MTILDRIKERWNGKGNNGDNGEEKCGFVEGLDVTILDADKRIEKIMQKMEEERVGV